jgi:hypothetical protein
MHQKGSIKIDQMAIKYTNILYFKTLQDLPTSELWVENIPSSSPVSMSRAQIEMNRAQISKNWIQNACMHALGTKNRKS